MRRSRISLLKEILTRYIDECRKSAKWIQGESDDKSIFLAVNRLSYLSTKSEEDLVQGIRHASSVLESLRKIERSFHEKVLRDLRRALDAMQ